MRIAVLDDDPIFLKLVEATIHQMGHATILFETGEDLLRAMRRESFDLLIVDWLLPGLSGIEVVRALREAGGNKLPILFASQCNEEKDIVAAFNAGADDFMTKPLRVQELMARVSALMRRAYPDVSTMRLDFDPYRLEPHTRTVYLKEQPIELKHREYELAEFLFQNCGRLLSRSHLTEAVWGSTPLPHPARWTPMPRGCAPNPAGPIPWPGQHLPAQCHLWAGLSHGAPACARDGTGHHCQLTAVNCAGTVALRHAPWLCSR